MFKEFDFRENKQSFLLQCIVADIVSIKFNSLSIEKKLNRIMALDEFVSEKMGIPCAKFVEVENKEEYMIDDICLGDINEYNSGLKLLFKYLFYKRQQQQRYCVEEWDTAYFTEEQLNDLKLCHQGSPITRERMYIEHKEGTKGYLLNYNNSDAYIYASYQLLYVLEMIDVDKLHEQCDPIEKIKFVLASRNVINSCTRAMNFLANINKKDRFVERFYDRLYEKGDKLEQDYAFIESLHLELSEKVESIPNMRMFCCFNKRIWKNLDFKERIRVVESCNEQIASMLSLNPRFVNYLEDKLIDLNDFCVSVGDVNEKDPWDIFRTLVYSYVAAHVVSEFENGVYDFDIKDVERWIALCNAGELKDLKASEFIKEVSSVAVKIQNIIYDCVEIEYEAGGEKLFGDRKRFVYDLEFELNNASRRKK